MRLNRLILSLLAGAALVAGPAHGLSLKLQDNLGNIGTADDSGSPGMALFNAAIGAWTVNVTTGLSAPILGPNNMDLNSVNVSNIPGTTAPPGGYLDIWLSQTNFNAGDIGSVVNFIGGIGGTTGGTVTWMLLVDDNNALFGDQYVIDGGTNAGGTGGNFSDSFVDQLSLSDTFSLTLYVRINHGNGVRTTSFDYAASFAVPEPGTLALIGAGLLGFVFLRRRQQG